MKEGNEDLFRTALQAFPSPVLIVDEDVAVVDCNAAASGLAAGGGNVLKDRVGEILHCINVDKEKGGCGMHPACKHCMVRNSVGKAFAGGIVTKQKAKVKIVSGKDSKEMVFLVTAAPLEHMGRKLVMLVLDDISELEVLRGLVPICAWCGKIRNDKEYWESVESYLGRHYEVDFSHGICNACLQKMEKELGEVKK